MKFSPSLKFMTSVESVRVTSKGKIYNSISLGIGIDIPEKAIPAGELLEVNIGICLYGPFKFPTKTFPIAPILSLHPQSNIPLLKPIKITLPHIIDQATENDIEALGIRVIKADQLPGMSRYVFKDMDPTETNITFETRGQDKYTEEYATFSISHFCFLCLRSDTSSEAAKRKGFCISPMYPTTTSATPSAFTYHLPLTYYMRPWLEVKTINSYYNYKMTKGHRF